MHYFTYRNLNLMGAFLGLFFLSAAYILQYFFNQEPCSLCLLQRYALWISSFIFLSAAIFNPKTFGRVIFSLTSFFFLLIGFLLAARQIWIQNLPEDAVPNCTAGLDRLLAFQPLHEALKTVILGGGECAHVTFKILGLSLAEISALGFLSLIFLNLFILLIRKNNNL